MSDFDIDFGDVDFDDISFDDVSFDDVDFSGVDFSDINFGEEEEEEYSAVRGGVTTFLEGALGIGDELDAVARVLSDGDSWDDAIDASRKNAKKFSKKNENLSSALEWTGFAAGFLVPGAAVAKTGTALSKAQQIKRLGAVGAAEGAVYGALAGEETEGRLQGAALGGVLGGGIGAVTGKFLVKSADEIARIDAREAERAARAKENDSFIWGEEGLDQEVKTRRNGTKGEPTATESSTEALTRDSVGDTAGQESTLKTDSMGRKIADAWDYVMTGTKERLAKTNKRAGMLVTDSDLLIMKSDASVDERFEELASIDKDLSADVKAEILDIGKKKAFKSGNTEGLYDVKTGEMVPDYRAIAKIKTPEERKAYDEFMELNDEIHATELPGWKEEGPYVPSVAKPGVRGVKSDKIVAADYEDPMLALKNRMKDVQRARIVATVFGLDHGDLAKLKPKNLKGGLGKESRLDTVIREVQERAAKQGGKKNKDGNMVATTASKNAAENLADALKSTLVNSKAGAAAAGSMIRKVSSAGLLANWSNAALQTIEGVTLPLYQNGFKYWAANVPSMLKNTFARESADASPEWLTVNNLGMGKQFMGEVAAEGEKGASAMVDKVSSFLYKWTGVERGNDMGAEGLTNTALLFARDMVKKGDEKSLNKLKNHVGTEGMNKAEFNALVKELKSGEMGEATELFGGRSLLAMQPKGASAMPQAFNDMPNGRVLYSMLSYMNRMHNVLVRDIGSHMMDAQKYGLNTDKGKASFKQASINGVKYAALFGLVNGVWDDTRKAFFDANKRELLLEDLEIRDSEFSDLEEMLGFLAETSGNQLASLGSAGLINARAKEFGGDQFAGMPAPISMLQKGVGGLFDVVTEQDPTQLLRFGQSYVPGVSQLDKGRRAATGDRLFQEIAYDN
jgi:hypothetical protein